MLFGIEDFVNGFIETSMWTAGILTGLTAFVILLHNRWSDFRNRHATTGEPQPVRVPATPEQARTNMRSSR